MLVVVKIRVAIEWTRPAQGFARVWKNYFLFYYLIFCSLIHNSTIDAEHKWLTKRFWDFFPFAPPLFLTLALPLNFCWPVKCYTTKIYQIIHVFFFFYTLQAVLCNYTRLFIFVYQGSVFNVLIYVLFNVRFVTAIKMHFNGSYSLVNMYVNKDYEYYAYIFFILCFQVLNTTVL